MEDQRVFASLDSQLSKNSKLPFLGLEAILEEEVFSLKRLPQENKEPQPQQKNSPRVKETPAQPAFLLETSVTKLLKIV